MSWTARFYLRLAWASIGGGALLAFAASRNLVLAAAILGAGVGLLFELLASLSKALREIVSGEKP